MKMLDGRDVDANDLFTRIFMFSAKMVNEQGILHSGQPYKRMIPECTVLCGMYSLLLVIRKRTQDPVQVPVP